MNNDQFIRYKVLDQCFRAEHGNFDMETLILVCTRAVQGFHADFERRVSRSTVEHDLTELKIRYGIRFAEGLRIGKKKIYRYENPSYSLMHELLADGTLEQMLLQNMLDTITLYEDVPHYKWLKVFMQQQLAGRKVGSTPAVVFQYNPDLLGMEHFAPLLDAILQQQPLLLEYHGYRRPMRSYHIHPYMLKQFNDRWFLIARSEGYQKLTNYALDRIDSIKPLNIAYVPADINILEYFRDVIGVTRVDDKESEDVIIRIHNDRYDYISSKPIHETQTEIHALSDADHHVVKIHVQVNRELEAMILSFGNQVEVLEPQYFREMLRNKIENMIKLYI